MSCSMRMLTLCVAHKDTTILAVCRFRTQCSEGADDLLPLSAKIVGGQALYDELMAVKCRTRPFQE